MLLFEVTSSCIAWCFLAGADRVEGEAVSFDAAFPSVEQRLGTLQEVSTVGYVLHHGGTTVNRPVSRIDPDTLLAIRGCSRFLPEESDAVYRLAERGLSTLPAATHLLFCATTSENRRAVRELPPSDRKRRRRPPPIRRRGGGGRVSRPVRGRARLPRRQASARAEKGSPFGLRAMPAL